MCTSSCVRAVHKQHELYTCLHADSPDFRPPPTTLALCAHIVHTCVAVWHRPCLPTATSPRPHTTAVFSTPLVSHSLTNTLVGGSFMRAGSSWYEGGSGPQYAFRNYRHDTAARVAHTCQEEHRLRAARASHTWPQRHGTHKKRAGTEPPHHNRTSAAAPTTSPLSTLVRGRREGSHPSQQATRVEVGLRRVHDGAARAIPLRDNGKALRPPHERRHHLPCARHGHCTARSERQCEGEAAQRRHTHRRAQSMRAKQAHAPAYKPQM